MLRCATKDSVEDAVVCDSVGLRAQGWAIVAPARRPMMLPCVPAAPCCVLCAVQRLTRHVALLQRQARWWP